MRTQFRLWDQAAVYAGDQLLVREPDEVTPESLEADTTFFGDGLGLDSIDVLELAVAVEQRWGVRIDNRELGQQVMTSLGSLVAFIEEQRQGLEQGHDQ